MSEETVEWDEWVETRPENLRAWLREHMPTWDAVACWRLAGTDGHYAIRSFHTEVDQRTGASIDGGGRVTVEVRHVDGPGSRFLAGAMGITVFDVPIEDLVACGCGDFRGE